MKILLKQWFFPLLLALIIGLIIGANYTQGTILSGWDTLHPEFNFPLSFERMISGLWRIDQGLGAAAGHSHMADLPRVFLLWLASFILPKNMLRYGFFFSSLIAGVMGTYALVLEVCQKHKNREFVAFMGAIFYLVNLGTIQHYIVPFEMFAVAYVVVPWLILTASRAIEHMTKPRLLAFILVTILSSPMAYAATLWYGTVGCIILFLVLFAGRKRIYRSLILIATIFLLHAYWILPNLYVAQTHGAQIQTSKINRLFSPEAYAKGQIFGTPQSALTLKNMLFDWQIYNHDTHESEDLLKEWKSHIAQPGVSLFFPFVALLVGVGLLRAIRTKNRWALAFALPTILSFGILLTGTWPIEQIFDYILSVAPIAREALRFPFTKFSFILMMGISVFAALGVDAFLSVLKRPFLVRGAIIIMTLWALAAFAPAIRGNLIHPAMKITIPNAYKEMFSWFSQNDPKGKVAILPIHSFWGWTYYDWGYQGAGFLQFGISQPILDRDYDRWSPYNEQYQREMSYAVYNQDPFLLGQILEKYNISWILFDSSVIAPGAPETVTLTWFIPSLLERTPGIRLTKTFGNSIRVYERMSQHILLPASIKTGLPDAGPVMRGAPYDGVFTLLGTYQTTDSSDSGRINDATRSWFTADERFIGPTNGPVVDMITPDFVNGSPLASCSPNGSALPGTRKLTRGVIRYTSTGGVLCDHLDLPTLDHAESYIVGINSRNIQGFPLQLCISNILTRHCDVFEHLGKQTTFQEEWFFVPRLTDFGTGYTVNIQNFSVSGRPSVNEVKAVTIRKANEGIFDSLPSLNMKENTIDNEPSGISIKNQSPAFTIVDIAPSRNDNDESLFVFATSFDPGWTAWEKIPTFPYLRQLKDHVLVNNWENAWLIKSDQNEIIIFFWPQLLQWLGFLLLPIPFLVVYFKKI